MGLELATLHFCCFMLLRTRATSTMGCNSSTAQQVWYSAECRADDHIKVYTHPTDWESIADARVSSVKFDLSEAEVARLEARANRHIKAYRHTHLVDWESVADARVFSVKFELPEAELAALVAKHSSEQYWESRRSMTDEKVFATESRKGALPILLSAVGEWKRGRKA